MKYAEEKLYLKEMNANHYQLLLFIFELCHWVMGCTENEYDLFNIITYLKVKKKKIFASGLMFSKK